MIRKLAFVLPAVLCSLSVPLLADVIAVGAGQNHAEVVVNFSDGAKYQFDVAFSGTVTGKNLIDTLESDLSGFTTWQTYWTSWNSYTLDGMGYDGHVDHPLEWLGGENYWHYYVKDIAADSWSYASTGFDSRAVADGNWDGWVYGSADMPSVPEPATVTTLLLGSLVMLRRRKK